MASIGHKDGSFYSSSTLLIHNVIVPKSTKQDGTSKDTPKNHYEALSQGIGYPLGDNPIDI